MKRLILALIATTGTAPAQDAPSPAADYAEACNRHAFASLSGLTQLTAGNFGFSPYNSHQMAAILTEGARGATQRELLTLTQLPADSTERLQWIDNTQKGIPNNATEGTLVVEAANSLWSSPSHPFLPEFTNHVQSRFAAKAFTLSNTDPVTSAAQVNQWIRDRTRGRITQLIGPNSFDESGGGLVVVNTLYLRANWAAPFELPLTKIRPFHLPKGHQIPHPMMNQGGDYDYAEEADWQCLDLPLDSLGFALRILLPRREDLRSDIEAGLTAKVWKDLGTLMKPQSAYVMIPRFTFTTELDLSPLWASIVAKRLFVRGSADLSGMTATQPYAIRQILHTTTIEVTESGTTASAAAAAPADPFASPSEVIPPPPPKYRVFNADHPFLWFIVHRPSHLILFAGRFAGQSDE